VVWVLGWEDGICSVDERQAVMVVIHNFMLRALMPISLSAIILAGPRHCGFHLFSARIVSGFEFAATNAVATELLSRTFHPSLSFDIGIIAMCNSERPSRRVYNL
jgi:hypothetical protein